MKKNNRGSESTLTAGTPQEETHRNNGKQNGGKSEAKETSSNGG